VDLRPAVILSRFQLYTVGVAATRQVAPAQARKVVRAGNIGELSKSLRPPDDGLFLQKESHEG
jgi:hypothetical protein